MIKPDSQNNILMAKNVFVVKSFFFIIALLYCNLLFSEQSNLTPASCGPLPLILEKLFKMCNSFPKCLQIRSYQFDQALYKYVN